MATQDVEDYDYDNYEGKNASPAPPPIERSLGKDEDAWEPFEKDDLDFNRVVPVLFTGEQVNKETLEMLENEKADVENSQTVKQRIQKLLETIEELEIYDGLITRDKSSNYPRPTRGFSFFKFAAKQS